MKGFNPSFLLSDTRKKCPVDVFKLCFWEKCTKMIMNFCE